MGAKQPKSLVERRAELEKQLRSLTDRRDGLYTPGMTFVSGPREESEQVHLQIEELEATIAKMDEELKKGSGV
jgi:hypothetical protein